MSTLKPGFRAAGQMMIPSGVISHPGGVSSGHSRASIVSGQKPHFTAAISAPPATPQHPELTLCVRDQLLLPRGTVYRSGRTGRSNLLAAAEPPQQALVLREAVDGAGRDVLESRPEAVAKGRRSFRGIDDHCVARLERVGDPVRE